MHLPTLPRPVNRAVLALISLATCANAQALAPRDVGSFDPSRFAAMRYRMVGPARAFLSMSVSMLS